LSDETSSEIAKGFEAESLPAAVPPPPGAEHAYFIASGKNDAVLRSIDDLDRKIAVAIGALGVAPAPGGKTK